MSSSDTVVFHCPNCNAGLNVQSKGGPCRMGIFKSQAVPVDVAGGIEGAALVCVTCWQEFTIEVRTPLVELFLQPKE